MNLRRLASLLALTLVVASVALLAGCMKGDAPAAGGKLRVACTTTMVGDLVQHVGGDRVTVRVIMGAGVDPHTFKPAPGDFAELDAAPIVFYSGLHLEGKMVDVFEQKLAGRAFAVTSVMPRDRLMPWALGEAGAHDPHVWFDVGLWLTAIPLVRDKLTEKDPAGATVYAKNAEAYTAALTKLHEDVKAKLATVPVGRRVLITSHDAYGYFGRAYDVQVRGIQGISTESEAGLREVTQAVEYIVHNGIPALFVESSVRPDAIEQVVKACEARGVKVRIGGELFSDAMGAPNQHAGYAVETYEGMVRYNVDTIVNALK